MISMMIQSSVRPNASTVSYHGSQRFLSKLFAVLSFAFGPISYAQTPELTLPFGDCSIAYWSSNRNLDDRPASASALCFANWRLALGETSRFSFNARAQHSDQKSAGRVREAYLEQEFGAFDLRIGRQIIAWGRADRINPSDLLSPRDLRLLSNQDDDQRNGINAMRLRYLATTDTSITFVAAQFQANQAPQGSLPANTLKASNPQRTEWAAKLDHAGSGVDWALFAFDGFDRNARYRVLLSKAAAPLFVADYERVQAVGGDISSASGAWTWRAEFTHAQLSQDCAMCTTSKRKISRLVAGIDRDVISTLNVNLQFFGTYRSRKSAVPNATPEAIGAGLNRLNREFAPTETGLALRVSDKLLNDKLHWELSVTHDFTGHSSLVRPRLSYAVNDQIKISVGADRYLGKQQSYFGSLAKNSLHYLSVSLVF